MGNFLPLKQGTWRQPLTLISLEAPHFACKHPRFELFLDCVMPNNIAEKSVNDLKFGTGVSARSVNHAESPLLMIEDVSAAAKQNNLSLPFDPKELVKSHEPTLEEKILVEAFVAGFAALDA